jgi:hypothetical protein
MVDRDVSSKTSATLEEELAKEVIERIQLDVAEAKDCLLAEKLSQAHAAHQHRGKDNVFAVGDQVMLSTLHRRQEYKSKHEKQAAKFFLRFDGPYTIVKSHPEFSTYTLDLPNSPLVFPTFHASQLKRFIANDSTLFPSRDHPCPGPVVTADGIEEYKIDKIIDARR